MVYMAHLPVVLKVDRLHRLVVVARVKYARPASVDAIVAHRHVAGQVYRPSIAALHVGNRIIGGIIAAVVIGRLNHIRQNGCILSHGVVGLCIPGYCRLNLLDFRLNSIVSLRPARIRQKNHRWHSPSHSGRHGNRLAVTWRTCGERA